MNGFWFLFTARSYEEWGPVVEACNPDVIPHVMEDDGIGLGPMMDRAFEKNPDLDFYGWLADDTFPETRGWNYVLEFVAGRTALSYANDGGYLSSGDGPRDFVELTAGLCWGGDLLRATGSWSLGFRDAWIDMAWLDLLRPLGLLRYVPSVTVRHDNWRTGRREMDELDQAAFDRVNSDRGEFFAWQESEAEHQRQRIQGTVACVS